ncbi:hypothetical protein N7534_005114 [Penicillium rubens]|uniref:ER membrane protein n=1 Tax=Penicillium chrysogenum TaxID=5076 RepID=A0ABQ8WTI2_PENCH|nr:hypothetical protein N7524_009052 [Penicillium chrysogenum]KAJ5275703.1 hypothetical protein N7505_004248 [Penicillium chrysogenum]KAJ5859837.1 hypothetical protein N7534_005114 [Penicillium rubens]
MWLFRVFSSALFLAITVSSIPLAFDVGGKTCGLAFSLSLAAFYFLVSLLKVTTPERSWFRSSIIAVLRFIQWAVILVLLIWSLNRFSVDLDSTGPGWVERTFSGKRAEDSSIQEWLFGREGLVETVALGNWDRLLRWSTPVFQLAEGFCSLLVIQAAGQITRWLVNRGGRSDSWMIGLLVLSATIISSSVYFLWRVLQFPEISNVDAALIGVSVTCAVILCAWDLHGLSAIAPRGTNTLALAGRRLPPLPPIIMASYTTLMHALSLLPSIIHAAFNVITAVFSAVTPSVLISLAYRLLVLYASTRIIPAVRESGARALSQEASIDDTDAAGQVLGFLSYFAPSILIAVYTSLLMQHFASTSQAMGGSGEWWSTQGNGGGNPWRWINLACTISLYAVELWLGETNDLDNGVAGHWKTD